jgi:hypothetical protein
MPLFLHEFPDGYPEVGSQWVDTASAYGRINFGLTLAANTDAQVTWPTLSFLSSRGLDTAPEIVDYFSDLMFQDTLPPSEKDRLLEFLTTNDTYTPTPLNPANSADFKKRVEDFVGLLLSLPEWNYQ